MLLLVLGLSMLLDEWIGEHKLVSWIALMSILALLLFRRPRYKGLSTMLLWIVFGINGYAIFWLEPARVIRGGHLCLLALILLGVHVWNEERLYP